MGQLSSLQLHRPTRNEVLFYSVLGAAVSYFWWVRGKKKLVFNGLHNPKTDTLEDLSIANRTLSSTCLELNQIIKDGKKQLESLEAQLRQFQNKNEQLAKELEVLSQDFVKMKETKENLSITLDETETDLLKARKEILQLQEELDRVNRSSSTELVDRMITDLMSPRELPSHNGNDHDPLNEDNNQDSEGSSEPPDYDSEDDEDLWDPGDPMKFFKDSYLFESGGACVGGIWLAKDCRTSKQVVIKKIKAEKEDRPGYVHAIARQEISIIKHLQTHPNIIDFYEAYMVEKGKEYWIVMEYMDSKTLFDIVTNHKYLCTVFPTEPQIARISFEILKGLSYMHSKLVLHKDIKSENILFNEKMQIKLADFGNSTRVDDETGKAEPQEAVGTSYWMAPEIIAEAEHDGRADIWSFGVVLYEMLAGLPPYNDVKDSEEVKSLICKEDLPPPWKHEDEWSLVLRQFYKRCLVKDPTNRATADELLKHPFCSSDNIAPPGKVWYLMSLLTADSQDNTDDSEQSENTD